MAHNPVIDLLLGGLAEAVTVENGTAAGGDGLIPIRVYRPADTTDVLPLVVLMHGGGWATGSLDIYDWLGSHLAVQARAVVVSLEYRLALTHRWPAAADDCYAAFVDSTSIEENANAPILTKRDITAFRDLYMTPENRSDPYASPLLAADHSRLPPALMQVAEHDPIRDGAAIREALAL
jgi:acetyl esterase/lipase